MSNSSGRRKKPARWHIFNEFFFSTLMMNFPKKKKKLKWNMNNIICKSFTTNGSVSAFKMVKKSVWMKSNPSPFSCESLSINQCATKCTLFRLKILLQLQSVKRNDNYSISIYLCIFNCYLFCFFFYILNQ